VATTRSFSLLVLGLEDVFDEARERVLVIAIRVFLIT
jgi:hypothetical protein